MTFFYIYFSKVIWINCDTAKVSLKVTSQLGYSDIFLAVKSYVTHNMLLITTNISITI